MKKYLYSFAIAGLMLGAGCNPATQPGVQDQKPIISDFSLQTKCADAASKFISNHGYTDGDGISFSYTNHFNLKMSKCFVQISSNYSSSDSLSIDLYDALEGKHYATYFGHNNCNSIALNATGQANKCQIDSGSIWLDGNDTRQPADYHVGFQGFLVGPGVGGENTQKLFLDQIQSFMNN